MNFTSINRLVLYAVVVVFLAGCTHDGLTRKETKRIRNGGVNEIMPLLTVFSKEDSLILRNPARKVEKKHVHSKLIRLLEKRMLATVNDTLNSGVGIAAPQAGIGIKMILVKRCDKAGEPFEVYFNPTVAESSDSINSGFEGCLSVPGYTGRVDRSQHIMITYIDSTGEKKDEEINGFTAVIFQHEIDHLDGILYYDHILGGFKSLVPSAE